VVAPIASEIAQRGLDRLFVAQAVLQRDDRGRRAELALERPQRAQRVGRAHEHEEHLHAVQPARLAGDRHAARLAVDAQPVAAHRLDDVALALQQHDVVAGREPLAEQRAERARAYDSDAHVRNTTGTLARRPSES
jgi:nitroreductase